MIDSDGHEIAVPASETGGALAQGYRIESADEAFASARRREASARHAELVRDIAIGVVAAAALAGLVILRKRGS